MKRKYTIDIYDGKRTTRAYLECTEQPTIYPEDIETGNPARIEVNGIALEFEGEISVELVL